MTSRRLARALLALLALPAWAWAQAPVQGGAPPAPQKLVPVVEPGKPMRFEVVTPPAPAPAAPEPCDLDLPQDRRTTPSAKCMRCHDGSRAASATTGHRFDIEYSRYGKDLRQDPEKFNPKVVLVGGKVTCLSCHEPLSTAAHRLAAPMGGPAEKRLCMACHLR